VKNIISSGKAHPDCDNEYGVTGMHIAAILDDPLTIDIIAGLGGDLDKQCHSDGNAPLHVACRDGCKSAAAMLLRCISRHAKI
jgi:ankyrin repeat protein